MASVAEDDFDSDEDFRWAGDESGLDYTPSVGSSSRKSNGRVAPYPSCHHVSVISTSSSTASVGFILPSAAVSRCSSSMTRSDPPPSISTALQSILSRLHDSLISPNSSCRLAVADSGATNHMLPDKLALSPTTPPPT